MVALSEDGLDVAVGFERGGGGGQGDGARASGGGGAGECGGTYDDYRGGSRGTGCDPQGVVVGTGTVFEAGFGSEGGMDLWGLGAVVVDVGVGAGAGEGECVDGGLRTVCGDGGERESIDESQRSGLESSGAEYA